MTAVNIREFNHNMAKYLKEVKAGERVLLMERNVPIAEITPVKQEKPKRFIGNSKYKFKTPDSFFSIEPQELK